MSAITQIRTATLARVVILEPIQLADERAESLKLRIDVLRWSPDRFTCQIWRRETYRLPPVFQPEDIEEVFDAEIYVLDTSLVTEPIECVSADLAIEAVLREIEIRLSVSVERPFPTV